MTQDQDLIDPYHPSPCAWFASVELSRDRDPESMPKEFNLIPPLPAITCFLSFSTTVRVKTVA